MTLGLATCLLSLGLMQAAHAAPEGLDNDALERLIQERTKQDAPARPAASTNSSSARQSSQRSGGDGSGDLIMNAMSLIGVAYRFGGNSPTQGLDCSGFMQYIFRRSMGVNLPRTAAAMATVGQAVDRANLKPGDMVFFRTAGGSRISHVGMYIGNDRFIHAPRTGRNIEITSLSGHYWTSKYATARRINSASRFTQ